VCCGVCLSPSGVPEDERYEGDDLEVLARAEEAEEAAFGEEEVSSMRPGPAGHQPLSAHTVCLA